MSNKRNVLKSNKELQQILSKYPDDMKVVIGVESKHLGIGLFYDIVCGGLDTGSEKVIYIASEGLGQDWDMNIELAKEVIDRNALNRKGDKNGNK